MSRADMLASLRLGMVLLGCALSASAQDALDLLAAARQAQSARAFEGVVVFMHDGRFDAVRVVHRPGEGGYQQIASLSGMPRALFRDARETRIEAPGRAQRLPSLVFAANTFDASRVGQSYEVRDASRERIAGFDARVVDAVARDDVRHSQRLWINPDNGLLLGVALIGPRRETLQQVMFTSMVVDARRDGAAASPLVETPGEKVAPVALPAGFRLIAERVDGTRRSLVLSDGLAMITLYLEPRAESLDRLTTLRRSATQLASRQFGRQRAVAVGEVPLATAVDLANRAAQALND
ncbi:MAG TPA: MucB/RseB C-terminal domain-containing protein [Patescibacteria group bacterium]|nr:MucB/RseB C-terminal domain-containing protein [Patescibacteria group bacterium]